MKSLLLTSLPTLAKRVEKSLYQMKGTPLTEAICFFDLSASTALKLKKGHRRGVASALIFGLAATEITTLCSGVVVKELGDGVLSRFPDPLAACRAAINLRALCPTLGLTGSFGLTLGRVSRFAKQAGGEDIYGSAVDRCARIQNVASPQQILIDEPLYEVIKSYLVDYPEVVLGERFITDAKGIGLLNLWELSTREIGLINRLAAPFRVYVGGRLSIEEKVQFASHAAAEVIEVGTGLTSFAKYFSGQKPSEFRDHIAALLRRGVTVKCFAVDPKYRPARLYLEECGEADYEHDLIRARALILAERRRLLAKGYPGRLEYYAYRRIPEFHCIAVDGSDWNGRLLLAPYLPGLSRAECPVYQVARSSDPELYEKYWAAILTLQRDSKELR